jgi:putative flavoprotein involved in K+ transport
VVGAGNTGAEIALDVVSGHPTWLSRTDTHHVPFRIETVAARHVFLPLVLRVVGHHVLTVKSPIGRKVRRKVLSRARRSSGSSPRTSPPAASNASPGSWAWGTAPGAGGPAGPRVTNVIRCTGLRPDFSWIDLPVFGDGQKEPMHHRGVVADEPGLYFVGLLFLCAMSSAFLPGVGRDAKHIAAREPNGQPVGLAQSVTP